MVEELNQELMTELLVASTTDEVMMIAKKYDVELSGNDAEKILAVLEQNVDGMSEKALGAVVGGISLGSLFSKTKSVAKSAWHEYDSPIQDTLKAFLEKEECTSA